MHNKGHSNDPIQLKT